MSDGIFRFRVPEDSPDKVPVLQCWSYEYLGDTSNFGCIDAKSRQPDVKAPAELIWRRGVRAGVDGEHVAHSSVSRVRR